MSNATNSKAAALMRTKELLDQLPRDIHGFWIPREDRFQGEYIHPYDERLAHITGFTGSAGLAIITRSSSALFVDSRYTLQAQEESSLPILPLTSTSIQNFLEEVMGGPIGCDPWLMTDTTYQKWENFLQTLNKNPVDAIWQRSLPNTWDIVDHPLQWAGATTEEKLEHLTLVDDQAYLICDPATIAWLCNIRAHCVPYTPVVPGWALVWRQHVYLWANARDTTKRLTLASETDCLPFLQKLPKNTTIFYDPSQTPYAFVQALPQAQAKPNPFLVPKSCKNLAEQNGMRQAHVRDGVAVTEFLAYICETTQKQNITEQEAADRLLEERKKQENFQYPSFTSISASGSNGAIVHYRPEGNTPLKGLYLIDSGGQYLDGTTDVTRVLAIDPPTEEQIQRYTEVLRGHIALAKIVFPKGTTGHQLDVLARQYLWQKGCNYGHGTSHGVGSYLSVHESPPRISPLGSNTPLEVGMVLSNEPGYYKTGEYGIRLENVMMVVPSEWDGFLCFETLTCVPFEIDLLDISQLTAEELAWLKQYMQHIEHTLSSHLSSRGLHFLQRCLNGF